MLNKVHAVLQKYRQNDSSIRDKSLFINLANFMLNSPITSDEFVFAIYVYIVGRGGICYDEIIKYNKIELDAQPQCEYISV